VTTPELQVLAQPVAPHEATALGCAHSTQFGPQLLVSVSKAQVFEAVQRWLPAEHWQVPLEHESPLPHMLPAQQASA
jgi:hypothetical protein